MNLYDIYENLLSKFLNFSISPSLILLLGVILVLLILSAFFSGSETALTGASRAKLMGMKEKGSKAALRALKLRENNEKLIGCGALKFLEEWHGEFKSIRIHDNFRNKGYGVSVINHLIKEAKKLKVEKLSIETGAGDFFLPARKLFKKWEFEECQPFAHYKEDVNSVYLTKIIDTN